MRYLITGFFALTIAVTFGLLVYGGFWLEEVIASNRIASLVAVTALLFVVVFICLLSKDG